MSLKDDRAQKGLIIAADGDQIKRLSWNCWQVQSQSRPGMTHTVRRWGVSYRCSCEDFANGNLCQHSHAIAFSERIKEIAHLRPIVVKPEVLPTAPILSEIPPCRKCGGSHFVQKGIRRTRRGTVQRFQCKGCKYYFTPDDGFARLKARKEIVAEVFDSYMRGMSFRGIQNHLKEFKQLDVSWVTVGNWVHRMGDLMSEFSSSVTSRAGENWHADETYERVGGDMRYVWNVMDRTSREWLASLVTSKRDANAARRALRVAADNAGKDPTVLITDKAGPYPEAIQREFNTLRKKIAHFALPPIKKRAHDIHPGNNVMERLNGTEKQRTKVMRGMKSVPTAQRMMDSVRADYNLTRPHMGLNGETPFDAAGVPVPILPGASRVESIAAAATRRREEMARANLGAASEQRGVFAGGDAPS